MSKERAQVLVDKIRSLGLKPSVGADVGRVACAFIARQRGHFTDQLLAEELEVEVGVLGELETAFWEIFDIGFKLSVEGKL